MCPVDDGVLVVDSAYVRAIVGQLFDPSADPFIVSERDDGSRWSSCRRPPTVAIRARWPSVGRVRQIVEEVVDDGSEAMLRVAASLGDLFV